MSQKNMHSEKLHIYQPQQKKTLKNLVDTPFKKIMFGVQILSYILILGSPAIGALIKNLLHMQNVKASAVILGVFITGEILFYSSLAFLGKELILILKEKARTWLKTTRNK